MDASTAVYRQSLLGSLNGHYLMLPTVPVYKRGKFLGHYWMFFPFSIHKFVLSHRAWSFKGFKWFLTLRCPKIIWLSMTGTQTNA